MKLGFSFYRTEWEDRSFLKLFQKSLIRPWRLIATQPIIQILGLYQAFNYGMLYLIISSFPTLWEGRYGFPKAIASLNYLALLGSLLASQVSGRLMDKIHAHLSQRGRSERAKILPEFRLPLMVPAAVVATIGIFLFGWSAQARLHWIIPDVRSIPNVDRSIESQVLLTSLAIDRYCSILRCEYHLLHLHSNIYCGCISRLCRICIFCIFRFTISNGLCISFVRAIVVRKSWLWYRRHSFRLYFCLYGSSSRDFALEIWC
jgi:hypothetical protein